MTKLDTIKKQKIEHFGHYKKKNDFTHLTL